MNPIPFAVSRPHTVAVAGILLVLFSVLALREIPIQLKPTVDVPRVNVSTRYRGASAVEVEEQVTRELEDVLQSVSGMVQMTSTSSEGSSSIELEFKLGTDVELAMVDVVSKLSQVPRLPVEADEPVAKVASSTDREMVVWFAARSGYPVDQARRLVEEDVAARMERVAGVSSVMVVGGSPREIHVRVDPARMVALGVSFEALDAALVSGNLNVRGGTLETGARQLVVRTLGKRLTAQALEDLIVLETDSGSVHLGDVAEVLDTVRRRSGFVNMDGKPAVGMGVRRQVGANVVSITEDLMRVADELNASFSQRGVDLYLDTLFQEKTYIDAAMGFVRSNMLLGGLLAVAVLLIFLRNLRSILVIAVTIPVSLLAVFLVLKGLDRSLNVISLAGIAFASGMVVDNAIVVLENVFRHLEMGKSPKEAAVDGGREVWGGVLASTLTTVAVFVPILIQQDESSQLFKDLALAISAAVSLSLVVALSGVPVMSALLFKTVPEGQRKTGIGLGPLGWAYDRFCKRLERPRPGGLGVKIGFVLVVLAMSLVTLTLAPPAGYLPTGNRAMVMFFASPVPGTSIEAVAENYKPFEEFAMAQPEFDRMFAVSGGFNGGGIVLKPEYSDAKSIAAFHSKLFYGMSLPGWQFFVPVRSSIFQDPGKQFEVELSGPDFEALGDASGRLQERLTALPGVTSVRSSLVLGRPELRIKVDEGRAKDLGLSVAAVGRVVETVLAGRRLTTLIDAGREVDVNLVADPDEFNSVTALEGLVFLGPKGEEVTLASLATVQETTGPVSIRRLERERNVLLTVNIAEDMPLQTVVDSVQDEVFPTLSAELGASYTLGVGGSADKLKTTLDALTGGLGLSVLIVYLLLVSLFRSWFGPLVILVTVPLALSGGILGIRLASYWTDGLAAFDVIAMLGFVILAGLVVNNGILIVHQAGNLREAGVHPRLALADSARSRLRPILMSVVTTVFGMLPLAIGGGAGAELYQGLGAVLVGGLVVSTIFTLFLVPVLLSIGQDLKRTPAAPAEAA
ncbi:MAG: HAE1 family hydrophobic/amphiphilic exporter-1 [Planctomycetota bacterium]